MFNSSDLKTLEAKFAVKLLLLKRKNVIFKNTLSVDKLKKQYNLLYVSPKFRNVHNSCPYTFRGRSYFRIFGVSRYLAKRSITLGKFPGFVSASW
jgi:ribosomal protein S14